MIIVATSVLIDSLSGPQRSAPALRTVIERGERLLMLSLLLYEWLRGPRLAEELVAQEALLPSSFALPFGASWTSLLPLAPSSKKPRFGL